GHARHQVLLRHKHIIHHDLAGDRSAQTDLALDRRSAQTFPALLEDEAADHIVLGLGPDYEHVGNRTVSDPHLGALEAIAALDLARTGDHGARVGTVVGLGQAEAADPLAAGQFRQILLLLGLGAEL